MNLSNWKKSLSQVPKIEAYNKIRALIAAKDFKAFVSYTKEDYSFNWHHLRIIERLQLFAEGKIKKLLVFMPPQHGKSELTSRRLPAFILGINPDCKIVGASYSADLSKSFNRDVQRIIDNKDYNNVFPDTFLNASNVKTSAKGSFLRNADIFEIVNKRGFYKSVGVGGSLTGTPIDVGIIDDPIKDPQQANSPTYRARLWEWYTQVFLTRLHNNSQILITLTRWHEDDLAGRLLKDSPEDWEIISFPAILENEGQRSAGDNRTIGGPLWEERHSLEKLLDFKKKNPRGFSALYQQDPRPLEGGLVFPSWRMLSAEEYNSIKAPVLYGLDFGFSNSPAAFVELKIDKDKLYFKELIYKTKLGIDALAAKIKASIKTRSAQIIADSADPILIDHLRKRYGLNIRPAKKGKDSIYFGIAALNSAALFVEESSANIIQELNLYRYKEDADGRPLEEPVKEWDHALDALRYAYTYKLSRGQNNNILAYG